MAGMKTPKILRRGMVIDVNLDPVRGSETGKTRPCVIVTNDAYNRRVPVIQVTPVTAWNEKKSKIVTNVELEPSRQSGLTKKSLADCLQTRPIDHQLRLVKIRGQLTQAEMDRIEQSLKMVFDLP
jgi:mRNA interferase MazF